MHTGDTNSLSSRTPSSKLLAFRKSHPRMLGPGRELTRKQVGSGDGLAKGTNPAIELRTFRCADRKGHEDQPRWGCPVVKMVSKPLRCGRPRSMLTV